ncbi:Nitrile hydratase beta subunit [Arboricoccus pini]|uniref:Nitrile hydratase beta subunit n=1 Tax=Arboricoccus pini TaxID=1963835 RepID=A0A212R5L4_9PROT|nr:SH3-like domain-containing protein [Arboricoccus pini]SNB67211.1 Nitrile hydratase beta subunit [Arboricoccus pini]
MDEDGKRPARHDMGGVKQFYCDDIDLSDHELTDFDRQVDALRQILAVKGLLTVDELRRGIEALPADQYDRLGYYQRWIRSIAVTLIRRGVISEAELEERLRTQGP